MMMKIIDKDHARIDYERKFGESPNNLDAIQKFYQQRLKFLVNFEAVESSKCLDDCQKPHNLSRSTDDHSDSQNENSETTPADEAREKRMNQMLLKEESLTRNQPRWVITQFVLLLWLYMKYFYKRKMNYLNLFLTLFVSNLFFFILYKDIGKPEDNTIVAIQNRRGLCYLLNFQSTFAGLTFFVSSFISQRKLFLKHKDSRLYSELPFFLAQLAYLIPLYMIIYFVLVFVYYHFLGLNDKPGLVDNALQSFFFMFVGGFIAGQAFATILGSLCDRMSTMFSLVPILVTPLTVATGFFTNLRTASAPIQWLSYISPNRFSYQGLMLVEFQNPRRYRESCVTWIDCPDNSGEKCQIKIPKSHSHQCDPNVVMDYIQTDIYTNVTYICILILIFQFCGYLVLKIKSTSKKMKYKKNSRLRKSILKEFKKIKELSINELYLF